MSRRVDNLPITNSRVEFIFLFYIFTLFLNHLGQRKTFVRIAKFTILHIFRGAVIEHPGNTALRVGVYETVAVLGATRAILLRIKENKEANSYVQHNDIL
jgi:hypothetical protein